VKAFGAKYRNLSQVYEEIKADWDGEPYIIREYADAPLLILDEIDKTSGSVWERNTLFKIIDGRYNRMKPTTLIANHFDQGDTSVFGGANPRPAALSYRAFQLGILPGAGSRREGGRAPEREPPGRPLKPPLCPCNGPRLHTKAAKVKKPHFRGFCRGAFP
jgi:hypothetical protein